MFHTKMISAFPLPIILGHPVYTVFAVREAVGAALQH